MSLAMSMYDYDIFTNTNVNQKDELVKLMWKIFSKPEHQIKMRKIEIL